MIAYHADAVHNQAEESGKKTGDKRLVERQGIAENPGKFHIPKPHGPAGKAKQEVEKEKKKTPRGCPFRYVGIVRVYIGENQQKKPENQQNIGDTPGFYVDEADNTTKDE
jgi:hypothetical protein